MSLPVSAELSLVLAVVFGMAFGLLLQRGRVTYYDVIVNQFRFKDFTVLKVMLTAVLVGGIGVWLLNGAGLAQYHIKDANLLAVALGAALFGIGMVIYGYCPGTGVAAVGQGSLHALVGFFGMLLGGVLYALSYTWVKHNIASAAAYGKIRLPDITAVPDLGWFLLLTIVVAITFTAIEKFEKAKSI